MIGSIDHLALARGALTQATRPGSPRVRELHLSVAEQALVKARAQGENLEAVAELEAVLRDEHAQRGLAGVE